MDLAKHVPHVERSSWPEYAQRFGEACAWLRTLGVPVNPTRAAVYETLLGRIADHHQDGTIDVLMAEHGFPALLNAVVEASEFIDIHAAFEARSDSGFLPLLKSYVGGAAILSDETVSGNYARNIGFELLVAALASSVGLPVHFAPPADICIPLEPHPFFIECKRPFTENKVENRIRHGLRQLVKRYDAAPRPEEARGFLALSISRIEHGGASRLEAPDEADLQAQIRGIIGRFIGRYKRHWERGVDRRTLAVLIDLRAPFSLQSPSLLGVARQHDFAMICAQGSAERDIFEHAIATPFRRIITT